MQYNTNMYFKIFYVILSITSVYAGTIREPRIIAGYVAQPLDLPVLASIRDAYQRLLCGGTILNTRWILTSGQCVSSANYVGVGNNTLSAQTLYALDMVTRHPSYSSTNLVNDVGLVRTRSVMQFDSYSVFAAPINTEPNNDQITNDYFYVAGWGTVSSSGTKPASIMYLNYLVLPQSNCTALNRLSNSGYPYNTTIQMCAQPQQNNFVQGGTCSGDAGDPLFYNGYIFGLLSRLMRSSCASGYPEVYTRLSFYLTWINSIIIQV